MTYWHQTGTAKMGQGAMSVVDATLKVHGIEHLRIADGTIVPRVTTGNTVALRRHRRTRRRNPSGRAHALKSPKEGIRRADRSARCDLLPLYSNRTSLKSIATISISVIGRRSGPRV